MKKFAAVLIISLASAGISFAGGYSSSKSYTMANSSKALNGDVRMLMWLGKQNLGQNEQVQDTESNAPLPWEE